MALEFSLSKEAFLSAFEVGFIIPITLKVFGSDETPIGIYSKLTKEKSNTFLLESAEQGVWSRYSFIGVSSRASIIEDRNKLAIDFPNRVLPNGLLPTGSGLNVIEEISSAWTSISSADLPPLTSGLVGVFAWDTIQQIEKLPNTGALPYTHPIIQLQLVQDVAVVDHMDNAILLIANVYCSTDTAPEAAYAEAISRLETMYGNLVSPGNTQLRTNLSSTSSEVTANTTPEAFIDIVNTAKEYVRKGDAFQVVISQRFDIPISATPIDTYRVLRSINPSPYMYLLNFQDNEGPYSIVGSSPEALFKVQKRHAVMHPIAGSRPRGKDANQDKELELSLTADAKEKAEHLMLVDLARNDLLKVCKADSISVTEFMKVHRFSHVMHLVSTVEGDLRSNATAISVLRATFPAGTLSGAPKPRALEIIDELEPDNRGIFGGVIGYIDFAGNTDLAIAIRSAFIRDGLAHIQAGAGIVLDSDPQSEYQETINKASAMIRAIEQANRSFGQS